MRNISVKEYYYKNIWPYIEHSAPKIDDVVRDALKHFENADWIKESLEEILEKHKDKNDPISANLFIESMASDVLLLLKGESRISFLEKDFRNGKIFIGEYPIIDLNASICFIPEAKGYLILINLGLLNFFFDMISILISTRDCGFSKFFTSDLAGVEEEIGVDSLLTKEDVSHDIKKMVLSFIKTKKVMGYGKVRVVPPRFVRTFLTIQSGILKFIIAHEFGHYALGHLNNKVTKSIIVPGSGISLNAISNSHKQELDADIFIFANPIPIDNTIEEHRTSARPNTMQDIQDILALLWGPLFFFSLTEVIDIACNNIKSTSHPSSISRYEHIRDFFEEVMGEKFSFFFEIFDDYRDLLHDVKDSLPLK